MNSTDTSPGCEADLILGDQQPSPVTVAALIFIVTIQILTFSFLGCVIRAGNDCCILYLCPSLINMHLSMLSFRLGGVTPLGNWHF